MPNQTDDILKRALTREKQARKQAEKILESKSLELFETTLELKKANEKLEILLDEKTTQLKGVFANINDAYIVTNLEGVILSSNNAANQLSGYNLSKENVHLSKLIYKEDYFSSLKIFQELKDKGVFNAYETRIITKDKAVKWTHINASLVYNHTKNQPIAIQCFIKDITETKQAAAIIKEQKKELEVIVDNSSLGIILMRFGKILKANHAIERILGYSEEELLDRTIEDISTEDDYIDNHNILSQIGDSHSDGDVTIRKYVKKDGAHLWAKTNTSEVKHLAGETKYQVVIIEDITVQREKTIVLNLINNIAKSILGKMDIHDIAWEITNKIATYLNSEDCIIYLVNYEKETIEQISAYGDKISTGHKIKNRLTAPLGEGIVGAVAISGVPEVISDTSKDSRYVVDDKRRLSEIAVPIVNNGNVIAVIDSEHKDLNYFTNDHLKTLENVANLVSMQLNSAINLRERQKVEANNLNILTELSKSNTELQEYAHIVSHDLKSPLRSIHALTSWIKEDNIDKLDELSLQNFDLIEVTLEKMEQLISGILNYSSVGITKEEELESVDLNGVIDDLKTILFIPDHISVVVKNKLPVLKGERIKLQQLFQNLISNGIKFNDKEKGLIEIDVKEKASYYQFSVKDNGIGINEKYFDKIFKIFHSLTDNKESTGIGLSIVKKIVDLYKGEIWVESQVKEHTTFYFTIKK